MTYDVPGPLKNLLPGNIDKLRGPYASVADANAAILNTIVNVDGVLTSYRKGKIVDIGTDATGYTEYRWNGGDYSDNKLVPLVAIDDINTKINVTNLALDKLAPVKNLFNKAGSITVGSYLSSTDGLPGVLANTAYSEYIPVSENTVYTLSGLNTLSPTSANVVVFYNASKVKISHVSGVGNYTHTTPAGTAFVRFNIRYGVSTGNYDAIQYEQSPLASPYNPYNSRSITGSAVNFGTVPDNSIDISKLSFYRKSKNLFNKNGALNSGYLKTSTGLPTASTTANYSDYIPVSENTLYTLSGTTSVSDPTANVIAFYNASKVLISFLVGVDNLRHTTPTGTVYVRFNVRWNSTVINYNAVQYELGEKSSYQAFGAFIDPSVLPDTVVSVTKSIAPVTDIYMIPCYGQSLSINTDAGASTFTTPVSIAYDVNLVNTNIQDMNGGYAEMFLALSKEYKSLPTGFKMMTCLGGAGGKSVLELSKGTTYYNTLMANITAGKATADANKLSYNVPAFVWSQGEEDYRAGGAPGSYGTGIWDPLTYKAKLKQLINDINIDVKSITGQTNDVKCVMYQVASHNPYYRYPRIAIQQLELAQEDERVALAKVMYEVDYNVADYVHAPAKTYRNIGNHYGIALYRAIVQNDRVLPIVPSQHFYVGTDLYIRFFVPVKPLVFDTSIVAPLPDGKFGFNLYTVTNETVGVSGTIAQATETITGVTLFSADTVKISLSAIPPAGTRLTYGVNGDGSNSIKGSVNGVTGKSGRTLGARGNLRDSRTYLNQVSNYFTLYNWCPIFEIIL